MNLTTAYRIVAILAIVAGAWASSLGQNTTHGSPAGLSCSPAPCVLPPIAVTQGGYDAPIAVDPANANNIIVGNSNNANCPRVNTDFSLSADGGSSWSDLFCMGNFFLNGAEYIPGGFPILGYDRNGVVYAGGFYYDDNGRSSFGFEGFQKSSDGLTWSNPAPAVVRQNYVPSYCWMAVDDSATSPYMNSVYISCVMVGPLNNNSDNQVVVTHSRDGGATWQQVNVAPVQKSPARDRYTAMTVGEDGAVYVTWEYCNQNNACDNGTVDMAFSKSTDGGHTWSKPKLVAPVNLIYPVPNTQIFVPNTPAIAVDNSSSSHSGNLYVVMYNWTGTFMQVQVARSTNGGSTWSKPVPVAPGITHDQFLPWISVSPNGLVGVSWLDRRNDPANIDYQAFAGISSNGGLSFQNVQLTTGFSDPTVGVGTSLGDYDGNAWDGPNDFAAAWMDNSNGSDLHDEIGGIRLK